MSFWLWALRALSLLGNLFWAAGQGELAAVKDPVGRPFPAEAEELDDHVRVVDGIVHDEHASRDVGHFLSCAQGGLLLSRVWAEPQAQPKLSGIMPV